MEITNNTTDTNTQQPSIPNQQSISTRSTQPSIPDQPYTSTETQPIPSISRRNAPAASNQLLQQHAIRASTRTRKTPKRLIDYIIQFD